VRERSAVARLQSVEILKIYISQGTVAVVGPEMIILLQIFWRVRQ